MIPLPWITTTPPDNVTLPDTASPVLALLKSPFYRWNVFRPEILTISMKREICYFFRNISETIMDRYINVYIFWEMVHWALANEYMLMEYIICEHILNYLESRSIISHLQHGFRSGMFLEIQLIIITHNVMSSFDKYRLMWQSLIPHDRSKLAHHGIDKNCNGSPIF